MFEMGAVSCLDGKQCLLSRVTLCPVVIVGVVVPPKPIQDIDESLFAYFKLVYLGVPQGVDNETVE